MILRITYIFIPKTLNDVFVSWNTKIPWKTVPPQHDTTKKKNNVPCTQTANCETDSPTDISQKSSSAPHSNINTIDTSYKFNDVLNKYPTMHHSVTEMCTFLLQNGALWDMGLVHHGICVTGLIESTFRAYKVMSGYNCPVVWPNVCNMDKETWRINNPK